MMILKYITSKGDILPLTGNSKFKLSQVDGITEANVDISSTTVSDMDGDFVNSSRTIPRNIVLELSIENDVENTKRYILKYIKPKQKGILRLYQENREQQIEGIVESIDMPRYTNSIKMQISLYCSNPYWEDIEYTNQDISQVIGNHYFTTSNEDMLYFPIGAGIVLSEYNQNLSQIFFNDGDVSVGLSITIIATGTVKNPVIYNSDGEYIGVDVTMAANDEIIIITEKGKKSITLNGVNVLSKIRDGSTWLQLQTGEEEFNINSDEGTEGNMYFNITFKQRYI